MSKSKMKATFPMSAFMSKKIPTKMKYRRIILAKKKKKRLILTEK